MNVRLRDGHKGFVISVLLYVCIVIFIDRSIVLSMSQKRCMYHLQFVEYLQYEKQLGYRLWSD